MEFHDQSCMSGRIRKASLLIARSIRCDEINKKFIKTVLQPYDSISVLTAVGSVHVAWNDHFVDSIVTPKDMPRLPVDAICPIGSTLLEISYVSRISGGMGSIYQFDGYFLSLIMAPCLTFVLDARGEKTS